MDITAPSSDAPRRVLDTAELLEAILLEVDDLYTILRAQRVDSNFRACAKNSPTLQKRLWFKPLAKKTDPRQDTNLNPLIFKHNRVHDLGWDKCFTVSALQEIGLPFDYQDGPHPKIEFFNIDIKRLKKAVHNTWPSFLSMYLQRPTTDPIKLIAGSTWRTICMLPTWVYARIIVKQQSFEDLVALALCLRRLADYMAREEWMKTPCPITVDRRTEAHGLKQPERAVWEAFFTTKQRGTLLSEPFFSNRRNHQE